MEANPRASEYRNSNDRSPGLSMMDGLNNDGTFHGGGDPRGRGFGARMEHPGRGGMPDHPSFHARGDMRMGHGSPHDSMGPRLNSNNTDHPPLGPPPEPPQFLNPIVPSGHDLMPPGQRMPHQQNAVRMPPPGYPPLNRPPPHFSHPSGRFPPPSGSVGPPHGGPGGPHVGPGGPPHGLAGGPPLGGPTGPPLGAPGAHPHAPPGGHPHAPGIQGGPPHGAPGGPPPGAPVGHPHFMAPNLPPRHLMPPPNMGYPVQPHGNDLRPNKEPIAAALPDLNTPFYRKRQGDKDGSEDIPPKTSKMDPGVNKSAQDTEPFDRVLQTDHRNAEKITVLDQYWQMLKHSPHDFHSWTYLLEHVETLDNLDACRGVFNAFLPLYPYCYAYWLRYSDLERKHQHPERALRILEKALEAIPLSADLWLSYLNLYWELYKDSPQAELNMRRQCERAIATAGLDFRSDALWEAYITWEADFRRLRQVTALYRRLITRPTRLFNKHWDAFVQHVRENNPQEVLSPDEYSRLRAEALGELAKTAPGEVATEDSVSAIMKERFLAALIPYHMRTETEVDRRWKYEEKIRRPYFHVKPLDRRQLNNWREYLEWEASCGDHERIVLLYERCLIACAHYEEFWCKYARYMERHRARNLKGEKLKKDISPLPVIDHDQLRQKARDALSTDPSEGGITDIQPSMGERGFGEEHIPRKEMHWRDVPPDHLQREMGSECMGEIRSQELKVEGSTGSVNALKESGGDNLEAIRELYRRATVIHCPNKPTVTLQWAQFEEEQANLDKARELIKSVEDNHPGLLVAAVQRIDLERRQGKNEVVLKHYKSYMDSAPSQAMKSWFAIKFARFTFKVMNAPDAALKILRMSLKKDRGNHLLYQAVLELCYQRQPTDAKGFCAAADLAIHSAHLDAKHKLEFARRKEQFLHEFGDLIMLRDASDQVEQCERDIPETEKTTKDRGITCDLLPTISNHTKEKKKKKDKEHKKKKKEKHSSEGKKDEKYITADGYKLSDSAEKQKKRHKRKESGDDDEDEEGLIKDDEDKKKTDEDGSPGAIGNHKDDHSPSRGTEYPVLPEPQEKSLINIPEWFPKDGGEVMIGETSSGMSVLRYFPFFLNDRANGRLFRSLRRFVKWSNILLSRQIAWYGPCDYEYNGNLLVTNSEWNPDMIDLLSRINQITGHEFNSCLVSLFRHGNDCLPWEAADSLALGRNPPLATISLGGSRVIELCRRAGPAHAVRMPLRPGSLLVLEGATQSDWCQQIPRDATSREELISLSFRVMYHLPTHIYP